MEMVLVALLSIFLAAMAGLVVNFAKADGDFTLLSKPPVKREQVEDKVVWITGASRGIGEVLARQFAALGAKLILSSRNLAELERVKSQLVGKHAPEGVVILPLDLSTGEKCLKGAVEKAEACFSGAGVDFMIHNAASERPKSSALEVTEEHLQATFSANVVGTVTLTRLLAPYMLRRGGGHFVVMSSAAGKVPAPGQAVYSASKCALNGYFHTLRSELLHKGIKVTVVCPGPIDTSRYSGPSPPKYDAESENHMSTERCAQLTIIAAVHGLKEAWISKQPVLLAMYVVQYMPTVGYWILDKIGGRRLEAVESKEGIYGWRLLFGEKKKKILPVLPARSLFPASSNSSWLRESVERKREMVVVVALLLVFLAVLGGLLVKFARADGDFTLLSKGPPRREEIEDKVVWITGASRGIGEILAKQFANLGARLILSARNVAELERVKAELIGKHAPHEVEILPLDLASGEESLGEAVNKAATFFNGAGVDYMVHNAAYERPKTGALDVTEEGVQTTFRINVLGTITLTRLLAPVMLKRGKGHFVVMSSAAGKTPAPGQAVYSATKHALNGYFHTLRSELCQKGIKVTIVCPGPIETSKVLGVSTSQHSEKRVSSERCAELTIVAATHGLKEAWISYQPVLLVMYLVQYMPTIGYWLMDKVGPNRVEAAARKESAYSWSLLRDQKKST
ncbi:hypothetical protein Taro_042270 [Colocasia esculenta]|uniref:Ketoreductase domain-containing protein n=1 Tax=Colocasia esculenta TaxID=4460 RepID=A0A843WDI5_COLES|nr:hypothetical protein [Colocasia esculenta]